MTTRTVTLPQPLVYFYLPGAAASVTWLGQYGRIPAALVDGGGEAYLGTVRLTRTTVGISLTSSSTDTGGGGGAGPDLSAQFETHGTLTLAFGDVSLTLPASTIRVDGSEPYVWSVAAADMEPLLAAINNQAGLSVTFNDNFAAAPTLPAVDDQVGKVGAAVDVGLPVATAGSPAPKYAATGLPAGLAFDANTRRIAGTPTQVETVIVTYTATNANGAAMRTFTFTINQAPTLPAVGTRTGVVGTGVDIELPAAGGGSPAPTYTATGLPQGLAFDAATRRITGAPTVAETVTVTYRATNVAGTATRTFTFRIDPAPGAPVLPALTDRNGFLNRALDVELPEASSGHPAPTYAATGLPDGLSFDPATRRVTGTPTQVETVTVTYRATNSEGSDAGTFEFAIELAPEQPELPDLPDRYATLQVAIDIELPAATVGRPAPTYAADGLPDGLSFDPATRRVTGTPTTLGTSAVTYTATNSEGSAPGTFDFVIEATGPRYERAQRALAPVDVVLTALEITHPDVSDPIRVVNDTRNRTIERHTFVALRFQPRLADDPESRIPRAELVIDNVGRALTQWVERSDGGSGASCRVLQVVAGEDVPQYDVTLAVASMRVTAAEVRVTLGHEPLFSRRAVRRRHDPETSPGLF